MSQKPILPHGTLTTVPSFTRMFINIFEQRVREVTSTGCHGNSIEGWEVGTGNDAYAFNYISVNTITLILVPFQPTQL